MTPEEKKILVEIDKYLDTFIDTLTKSIVENLTKKLHFLQENCKIC